MKRAVVAILAIAALAAPASALASPQLAAPIPAAKTNQTDTTVAPVQPLDVASDRTALNAYATYLGALVRAEPTAQQEGTTYVSGISSQCKSALEPLTQPNYQVDASVQETLTQLGEEMGDDLAITFDATAFTPFMKLYTAVSRLRWTRNSGGGAAVRRFLTTESNVLTLTPSELCQNALLATSSPQTVPDGTRSFLKSYAKASNMANNALNNMLRIMQFYEIPSEHNVITRIANLANQVSRTTKSSLLSTSSSLAAVLES